MGREGEREKEKRELEVQVQGGKEKSHKKNIGRNGRSSSLGLPVSFVALSGRRREEGEGGYREERRGLAAKLQLNLKGRRGERRRRRFLAGYLFFPSPTLKS